MLERLGYMAKQVLVAVIVITVVIFLLYNLFTDPVGSAHFVGDVFSWIWGALESLLTFGKELSK